MHFSFLNFSEKILYSQEKKAYPIYGFVGSPLYALMNSSPQQKTFLLGDSERYKVLFLPSSLKTLETRSIAQFPKGRLRRLAPPNPGDFAYLSFALRIPRPAKTPTTNQERKTNP